MPALLLPVLSARAIDLIYYDRATKKEVVVKSVDIDDRAEGITIKKGLPQMGVKLTFPVKVSGFDVRDVQLLEADIKVTDFLTYRKPLARVDRAALPTTKEADRIQLLKESLPDFKELIPKLAAAPNVKRHVEFKQGQTLYRLASNDETFRAEAIKVLDKFSKDHQACWQIAPALDMLASLHRDNNDLGAMQQAYESLANVPGVSDEVRTSSLMKVARVLIENENFAAAHTKLTELKIPADSPLSGEVALYLSQCELMGADAQKARAAEGKLRDFLTKTQDTRLKALTHNTLGDYYTKEKRDDDAFWEYLRVDTLFSEDRSEHARAMYHLIRLFRDVKKDGDRAVSYEEQLKDKKYAGLEYQKKLMKK
jgi:hypothetical protein